MDLNEALVEAGFEAKPCGTLAAARHALAQSAYALLILDPRLPDGDGLELVHAGARSPGAPSPLVLLLADAPDMRAALAARGASVAGFAPKPYEAAAVVA